MRDTAIPGQSDAPNPTCHIVMPKDHVKDMTVDKSVTLKVSGKVKSLHAMFSDEAMYEVEIEDPLVEKMDSKEEDKSGDSESIAKMKLGDLKKMISKPSEDKPKDSKENYDANGK